MRFNRGDLVYILPLSESMSHFPSDRLAVLVSTYADQYGGNDHSSLTLYVEGHGETAWYSACNVVFIQSNRWDLLNKWKSEDETERIEKSDLDYIFSHGPEIASSNNPHPASIQALAECYGLNNLWGKGGDGISYYMNCMQTMRLANPFLQSGDKEGWMEYCRQIKP